MYFALTNFKRDNMKKLTKIFLLIAALAISGCGQKSTSGFWYNSAMAFDYGKSVVFKNPHLNECFGMERQKLISA